MLTSVWCNTAFTSEMLTNRLLPCPCKSCYILTLIARYSNNHPPSSTPSQPVLLLLQGIWKNIPYIHIMRTFTNGSTKQSHNLISINLTTHHYHHPCSYTNSTIFSLPLTRRHSYIRRKLSSSSYPLNGAPHSNDIRQGHQLTL